MHSALVNAFRTFTSCDSRAQAKRNAAVYSLRIHPLRHTLHSINEQVESRSTPLVLLNSSRKDSRPREKKPSRTEIAFSAHPSHSCSSTSVQVAVYCDIPHNLFIPTFRRIVSVPI